MEAISALLKDKEKQVFMFVYI